MIKIDLLGFLIPFSDEFTILDCNLMHLNLSFKQGSQ